MADELNEAADLAATLPESRRDQMASLFEKAEAGEPIVDRPRDEAGKFVQKEKPEPKVEKVEAAPPEPKAEVKAEPAKPSLTTWRKEYLPIQEKLDKGEALNADEAKKLAAYNVEREKQYATGIATYKSEAQTAKQYTEAMNEFLPLLQQHNINPAQWIQNLGRAHQTLALGSPEQKIQMFSKLARDYGIPLGAVSQAQSGQLDPVSLQLMQEIQNLKQNLTGITTWQKQLEDKEVAQEVAKFSDATQYPHFEQVRETMIQLLESGVAQDPDEAYQKAIWLDPEVRTAEIQRQAPPPAQNIQKIAVGKAKAAAGQVRSAAPRSQISPQAASKDRRSALAASFEAADNTGRF